MRDGEPRVTIMARTITAFTVALASAPAMSGCAPKDLADERGEGAASIYYASQQEADAALAAFDRDNPECQLWTNWQKMCSRTGDGRSTECTEDHANRVRPSIPFCAAVGDASLARLAPSNRDLIRNRGQRLSRGRFCRLAGGVLDCATRRPFNGRSLAARRHRFCRIWSVSEAPKFEPVCSEAGQVDGLSECASKALKSFRADAELYCAKRSEYPRSLRTSCKSAGGWGEGPDYPPNGGFEISHAATVGDIAVIGMYCKS